MSRLVVGNLAAEIEMARAATPGPHPDVSAAAGRLIRQHARRLSIFPADRLWLPGDPWPPPPADELLAWAETDAVAALRAARSSNSRLRPPASGVLLTSDSWTERLWHLHPDPATARACNDRRFAFALAERNGWSLPGARVIRSLDELPGACDTWIAKAPFSAAGRERARFARSTPAELTRLERLLARYGELLLEPWVDRVRDIGCAGLVGDGVQVFPPHRLDVDLSGVFRAAVIDDSGSDVAEPAITSAVRDTAHAAADALGAAGYRGPFSVDAYLWRDRSGAVHLQRMSEINARLTFGLVARAAAEREAGGGRFELRL